MFVYSPLELPCGKSAQSFHSYGTRHSLAFAPRLTFIEVGRLNFLSSLRSSQSLRYAPFLEEIGTPRHARSTVNFSPKNYLGFRNWGSFQSAPVESMSTFRTVFSSCCCNPTLYRAPTLCERKRSLLTPPPSTTSLEGGSGTKKETCYQLTKHQ